MSQDTSPVYDTGGEKIMEEVNALKGEVGELKVVVKNHVENDHEKFEILTNSITMISNFAKESIALSKKSDEKIEAMTDLVLAIKDKSEQNYHELDKKIIIAEYNSKLDNKNQDLYSKEEKLESSKNSLGNRFWKKLEEKALTILVTAVCTGLVALGYQAMQNFPK